MTKKVSTFLFLLTIISVSMAYTSHKYYFSLTDIQYNKENSSLEIITNVFMDDIELEMNKKYNVNLQLTTKNQYTKVDSLFNHYFQEKLSFEVNNNKKKFKYVGIEYEGDLVYIYMEISDIKDPINFKIKNTILINEFESQQNVVKIKVGKTRRSDILTKKNVKTLLNF